MPRPAATEAEIKVVKDQIIEEAIGLIHEGGFQKFSMRNLGARLGIAAKTIYNYFTDKDELYLALLSRGFLQLESQMRQAATEALQKEKAGETGQSSSAPLRELQAMAGAYVRFGLENPGYYNVLFNLDLPRFADYYGTKHESLAEKQNDDALRVAHLAEDCISRLNISGPVNAILQQYRLMRLWSTLHGIVSLYNSRVTMEVGDFRPMIPGLVDDAVKQVLNSDP